MGEVVNLRQARKQKARIEKQRLADEHRALHGRSRAERERDRLTSDRTEKFMDGHRREKPGDPDGR
ncbi:MAG: DUF4169 family protein [Mesorhizobium sp.]|nr:MAG: DUF4169 family protein [Mesorhizobium sp.]